jgi:hypothetical protein
VWIVRERERTSLRTYVIAVNDLERLCTTERDFEFVY